MVSKISSNEAKLYPMVEKWMKKHFLCFKTAINTGLIHSRIDVLGIRDTGGDLSGDVETISIEVKRGAEPYATSCGQAFGYKIYANRVYLADIRSDAFTHEEIKIASFLGIGLIQILKNGICKEILTSPSYIPMPSHNLRVLDKLLLGKCQMCSNFFDTSNKNKKFNYSKLSRENLDKAIKDRKGMVFWNYEVGGRKDKTGIRKSELTYDRRFICPECVEIFFSK